MTRIYFRIIAAKGHQFISDFLGVFMTPAKTLRDISDRNDWAIPMLFLCLTAPFGLPFVISWNLTSATSTMFILPFAIALFYLGVYAFMRMFYRQKSNWIFFRLLGYIGVPYATVMCALILIMIIFPSPDYRNVKLLPVQSIIFVILLLLASILTIRILWLALRTAYQGMSGKSRFLCLVLAVIVANLVANSCLSKTILERIKASVTHQHSLQVF